jgi:hypothetical protein
MASYRTGSGGGKSRRGGKRGKSAIRKEEDKKSKGEDGVYGDATALLSIDLDRKPNWIAVGDDDDGSVCVVSNSCDISVYSGVKRG